MGYNGESGQLSERIGVCMLIKWRKEIAAIISICVCLSLAAVLPAEAHAAKKESIPTITGLKAAKTGIKAITLKWKPVKGAAGYVIYRANPGSKKYKKIKTLKNGKKAQWANKKLKTSKTYKYKISVLKTINGKKQIGAKSYWVSAFTGTKTAKKANVKSIKVSPSSVSLTLNQKKTLKVKLGTAGGKKPISSSKRWSSSNKRIAVVNQKGRVTARQEGICYIYCKAHNGKTAKVKVKVVDKSNLAKSIPILTFHRIVPPEIKADAKNKDNEWIASAGDFEQQMKYLHDQGYQTISMDEFYSWYRGQSKLPKKTVMLTFDDGDYELYYIVLPILKKYGFKGTAFIIGAMTEETTHAYEKSSNRFRIGRDLIDQIGREYPNLEFQSHSYGLHVYENNRPIVYSMNLDQLKEDFRITEAAGFQYIAYPYGAETPALIKAFNESSLKLAFGFKHWKNATPKSPAYDIPRVKINGQISFEEFKQRVSK